GREPDAFSRALFSMIGLGQRSHRNRMRIIGPATPTLLGQLDDTALLRFSGFLAHRPRCALSLEVFLQIYLRMPVQVLQFRGQWLHMESTSQSSLGEGRSNNQMGMNTTVGDRVWDVQSKVRIRLGPMSYEQFQDFLPDRSPSPERKKIFLLAQLVRFCLGAE